jgi:glutamate synthase (NADPH/NADH) small chain
VAEYKLPAYASLREIELIADLGVDFRYNVNIDAEKLAELERDFNLIFVGVGLGATHVLAIPGGDHPGILDALAFIAAYKTAKITSVNGHVIVVGAGNTAIDAANAARRLGAERVSIVYRRTAQTMSAFAFEYEHAKQEGVHFLWQSLPVRVHADGGLLEFLECVRVDDDLQPIPGSEFHLACDLIIPAIGQSPLLELLEQMRGVTLEAGRVAIDRKTGQTANPKYFAGGDCVNGGREVVDAVADGKRAALAMTSHLEAAHV